MRSSLGAVDPEFMKEFGLTADDYPDTIIEVWPENMVAIELYGAMSSQWRPGGSGLDYAGLGLVMDLRGIAGAAQRRVAFEGLQALEFANIERLAARRKLESNRK